MSIVELLTQACKKHASDLHISAHVAPTFRLNGELVACGDQLLPAHTEAMAREMMSEQQWQTFTVEGEADFSYSLPMLSRYRVNVYRQRGCISIAVRIIPHKIPSVAELRLPRALKSFIDAPSGLFLVTGPTGSGKTTTLAALIDEMNRHKRLLVIALEDPIEYVHESAMSMIHQREIGADTQSFAVALRAALRQDPDVIMIGEMRDLETIQTALTAAETGHMVMATLHTVDSIQTIDRIINAFPAAQQNQIRTQLAQVLRGIASQRLHKTSNGSGRVPSFEILVNTPAVANLIRTEKVHQIHSVIQTGRQFGMQTMETHMRHLISQGILSSTALSQP